MRALAIASCGLLLAAGCDSAPPRRSAVAGDDPRRIETRQRLMAELGQDYDRPLQLATAEQLERGAELYDLLCSSCHGSAGRGDGRSARALTIRPPDLSDPLQADFFSERAKLEIVREGIEGSPMIGWAGMMSDDEVRGLVLYMSSIAVPRPARGTGAEP